MIGPSKLDDEKSLIDFRDTRILILLLIHILIVVLIITRTLDPLFNDSQHRLGPGTDFYVYYNAAQHLLAGKGAYGHGPAFGFRYHPALAATLLAVLSFFSPFTAYLLWILISETAYVGLWLTLFKLFKSPRECIIASIILTFFSPYYLEIYMGNCSFMVAVLLLWAFLLYRDGRVTAAGVLLTLSVIIKPIGLVLLPALLMRKDFKLVSAVVLALIGLALPYFLVDHASFSKLVAVNVDAIAAPGWVVHAGNQGFHALISTICTRLSGIPTSRLWTYGQLPQSCAILIYSIPFIFVAFSSVFSWMERENLGFCLFLWSCVYLLGYKDIWEHTYSFTSFALIWLYLSGSVSHWLVLATSIWMALPTAFFFYDLPLPPGPVDPEHYWSFAVSMVHHATKSLGLFMAYVLVILSRFSAVGTILRGQ